MSRRTRIDWAKVDWNLRDVDIAKLIGCTRERVRQVRKDKGIARSPMWHKRCGTVLERIAGMDTGSMTPGQVAKKAGCKEAYAVQCLRKLRKDYKRPPDGRRKGKYDWGRITPELWENLTDKEVAGILGVGNPAVVTLRRRRKGIMKRVASEVSDDLEPVREGRVCERVSARRRHDRRLG